MAGGRWWEEGGGGGPLQVFKFWFSNIIFSLPLFVERSNLHIMQMMFFLHVRGNNLLDRGFPNNVLGTSLHKEREMRWMIIARPLKREEGTGHTNLICVQCAVVCTSQSNYASLLLLIVSMHQMLRRVENMRVRCTVSKSDALACHSRCRLPGTGWSSLAFWPSKIYFELGMKNQFNQ